MTGATAPAPASHIFQRLCMYFDHQLLTGKVIFKAGALGYGANDDQCA